MSKPKQPLTPAQAMNRAAALCAASEQAPGDMRDKLVKWGLTPDDAATVLEQLTGQGFIDERRFARAFAADRFAFNGWGRIKIAHQLRQKGITASEVIDEAMSAIDEDKYRDKLTDLLRAKWRDVCGREPRAAWAAMMRFAASRGFEPDLAADAIRQVTHTDDAQDD